MAIITRFGGSGGGTPIVDPYPHVWECTVVQSGTTGVVSGVVTLEAYDILHYTMPLGFSTYDLMIGGVVYTTSFRNEGEMYIQWTGSDFVVVSANAACALPHVWVNPTYTITGSVLEITSGVDDLHANDVIELTLSSGESASVIEYDSNTYLIDTTIDDSQTNYVMFNGTSFELLNPKFNFLGNATVSDVLNGKTFYGNSNVLLTGSYVPSPSIPTPDVSETEHYKVSNLIGNNPTSYYIPFTNVDLSKCCITVSVTKDYVSVNEVEVDSANSRVKVTLKSSQGTSNINIYVTAYEFDNAVSITRTLIQHGSAISVALNGKFAFYSIIANGGVSQTTCAQLTPNIYSYNMGATLMNYETTLYINILEV